MSQSSIDTLPEEVLERILSLCQISESPLTRPNWLPASTPISQPSQARDGRSASAIRTRLSPLLVSKKFYRISIPHYYSTIYLTSAKQTAAFLHSLQTQEHTVGPYVRTLVSSCIFPLLGAALQHCNNLRAIDICVDSGPAPSGSVDHATEAFCNALDAFEGIKHLTLRKASNAYLTLPRVRHVLTRLAITVEKWTSLESANIAFRMSDDNPYTLLALAYPSSPQGFSQSAPTTPLSVSLGAMSPLPVSPTSSGPFFAARSGPMSLLTTALAKSPSLHTFATHVPNVWNETILCVSQNPSLQKIVLGDPRRGVMITGLFMSEARRHARLADLIKAGTPMIRTRSHSLGNFEFGNVNTSVCGVPASDIPSTGSPVCAAPRVLPQPQRSNSLLVRSSF
ncbi:hypothetical protein GYMLUDRAFT_229341 [Collybiopsis luxurians FD-317 M1]|uniref:F-box domain-containing protein n=1 Tax=Collybiopsis luxurians FD-317 M1 TaxID=944289 RepID=A0A0D0CGX3_9AGAR|nr:hypothetical protein GYMLUDRAFT_229341 [Collybiopsis luxurians FD-317 M1]